MTHHLRHDTLVTVTSGKFVTHANLTLLGHINLGHLQNARGQLVTNGDSKLAALHLSIEQFVFLHVVDNQLGNE